MHKVALYSPYLDTLSGGERYITTIAECLSARGYKVEILWKDKRIKDQLSERLNVNLSQVKINQQVSFISSEHDLYKRWSITKSYRAIFFLSDGSIPYLFSQNNFLLFQNPFPNIKPSITNTLKLKLFRKVICNSYFTKRLIDSEFGINSIVIYPPVNMANFKSSGGKNNIILSVGRFVWNKKQDLLISVFKQLCDGDLRGWRLLLAGSTFDKSGAYMKKLEKLAAGYPIDISINPRYEDLKKFYEKSKIYWHGAGYGEKTLEHPELTEHFGISTVEAMAARNVPVVVNLGGQPEIVTNGEDGFLWNSIDDLKSKTLMLIENPHMLKEMSFKAEGRSRNFGVNRFCGDVGKLLEPNALG